MNKKSITLEDAIKDMNKNELLDRVPPEVADSIPLEVRKNFARDIENIIREDAKTTFLTMTEMTDKTWAKWDESILEKMQVERYYTLKDLELMYDGLALAGEAGELANLVKKHFRKKYLTEGHSDPDALMKIPFELADCLYYILRICKLLDIDLEEAFYKKMEQNIKRYVK